jgi:predicted esterase
MLAAGWDSVVVRDWAASLAVLSQTWKQGPAAVQQSSGTSSHAAASATSNSSSSTYGSGSQAAEDDGSSTRSSSSAAATATSSRLDAATPLEFDGVLGFSNGAAAAFLFAAHAAANKEAFRSLQFVILAGGYLPEPLSILAPGQQVVAVPDPDLGASPGATVSQLVTPLAYPSLHIMGSNDPLISCEDAQQVVENFQEAGRQVGVLDGDRPGRQCAVCFERNARTGWSAVGCPVAAA